MNQILDLTIILAFKLILIIGFIVLMKFWLKKQKKFFKNLKIVNRQIPNLKLIGRRKIESESF